MKGQTMTMFPKIAFASPALVGAMALSLMAAGPADAQSRHRDRDRDHTDDRTADVLIGAAIGALAGAALVAGSNDGDCDYYRGGRCYRNRGHWEREHGINSRDGYDRYERRLDRRDRRDWRRDRRDDRRYDRDYRYERRW